MRIQRWIQILEQAFSKERIDRASKWKYPQGKSGPFFERLLARGLCDKSIVFSLWFPRCLVAECSGISIPAEAEVEESIAA
jgi:hypothetical protein